MKNSRVLRTYPNAISASVLQTRLEAAGIPSVTNGDAVATTLSYIGPAVASVRVEVLPEHYEQACEVLREDDRLRSTLTAWICGRCDEVNEATFELCWGCSKQRDEQDRSTIIEETESVEPMDPPPAPLEPEIFSKDAQSQTPVTSSNPYHPPPVIDGATTSQRFLKAAVLLLLLLLVYLLYTLAQPVV